MVRSASLALPAGVVMSGTLVIGLVVQTLFLFTMPLVLLARRSILQSVRGALSIAVRSFPVSFRLVVLPFLLTLPTVYIETKSQSLVRRLSPEIMIHLQISTEIVQWIAIFLLLGGLTSTFLKRIHTNVVRHE